jgi:soluble lytic murein transglycosylase-like protein
MKPFQIQPSVVRPQSSLERMKSQPADSLDKEKARLRKATKEFESFFTYYMLKTMRQTVPKDPMAENLPLGDANGKDTFSDMFDMEVSRLMSSKGQRSISDMLYRSMVKVVEAQYQGGQKLPRTIPLKQAPHEPVKIERQSAPIALPRKTYDIQPQKVETQKLRPVDVMRKPEPSRRDHIVEKFGNHIDEAARQNNIDSSLIASVIRAESGGDTNAVSKAGAKGLMQLVDSTAQQYGVKDAFDPKENIHAGSRFLRHLLDRYKDLKLALAAYNAGPGNVDKFGGIPPFKETQDFVAKVTGFLKDAVSNLAGSSAKEP